MVHTMTTQPILSEPHSWKKALTIPEWKLSMQEECNALVNNTYGN